MLIYDRKTYTEVRDSILKLLKVFNIGLLILVLTGCYNAAMMRATGESRQACQADSDCPADQMCVFNISPSSALGECVDDANYDPWKNRQLEDFNKIKDKKDNKKGKKQWKNLQQVK
jgi:hypothetical protein